MSNKRKQALNTSLTPAQRTKKVKENNCILYCKIKTSEYVMQFSKTSKETVLKAARLRNDNRIISIIDSLGEDLHALQYGYHRKCYQNYTHKKVIICNSKVIHKSNFNFDLELTN